MKIFTKHFDDSEIIHHPDGDITVNEIQKDIDAWLINHTPDELAFTAKTVQALLDKINNLSQIADNLAYLI